MSVMFKHRLVHLRLTTRHEVSIISIFILMNPFDRVDTEAQTRNLLSGGGTASEWQSQDLNLSPTKT